MKKLFVSVLGLLIFLPTFSIVHAETDELGYEFTTKKASEIDFQDGDFFVVLLSGEPTDPNALYAIYETSEIEKYEQDYGLDDNEITTFAALPTKFSQYYSSSKWITRNGKVSLSLQPKKPAYQEPPGMAGAHLQKYRWEVVKNKHSKDSKWKNTASMKAQLNCHADYPKKFKTPWNIEPWRTETNYHKVVLKGCNP